MTKIIIKKKKPMSSRNLCAAFDCSSTGSEIRRRRNGRKKYQIDNSSWSEKKIGF